MSASGLRFVRLRPDFAARLLIALAYGYVAWFYVVFLPGGLSLDSFEQYEQALSGVFNDHHPPLMAILLRLLMHVGLGVKTVIGGQMIAGVVGVHLLLRVCSALSARGRASAARELAIAIALVLLVSPATPLLFHFSTFWKDTWFAIALLWTTTSLLWVLMPELCVLSRRSTTAIFVLSVAGSILSRHNGIVLLPVLAAILLLHRWPTGWRHGATLAVGICVAVFVLSRVLYGAFDVERRYLHQNYVMWYDILTLCELDDPDSRCRDRLVEESAVKQPEAFHRRDPQLFRDWLDMARAHPTALARLKLEMFARTLNLGTGPHDYFHTTNYGGFRRYGLERDPARQPGRLAVASLTHGVVRIPVLRSLLGGHMPWFVMSVCGTLVLAWRSWRRRELDPRIALFALPLVYFLSYLPVFTVGDFRYMYPATIASQTVALAWATGRLADRLAAD